MGFNKLYGYIVKELFPSMTADNLLSKQRFTFKNNNHPFAIYELEKNKSADSNNIKLENGHQYFLKSHHISFYKIQNEEDEYHYTGYIEDHNGKKYQVHIYFNQNDKVAKPPTLSMEVESGRYRKVNLAADFSDTLLQFAIDHSFHVIAELRLQHHKAQDKYAQRYFELEKELAELSRDTMANYDAYQAKLKQTINVVSVLAECHYNPYFKDLLKLFRHIQEKTSKMQDDRVSSSEQDTHSGQVSIETNTTNPDTINSVQKILLASQLANLYETHAAFMTIVEDSLDKEKMAVFLAFCASVTDAFILMEDKKYPTTSADLVSIQAYLAVCQSYGRKFLLRLLFENQFELALSLKNYLNPIPDNLIRLALGKGNAELLDFLLTHGNFPINTFIVENNLTPVLYCFEKHSDKTPKMKCLSVLLKHHASILVKKEDGLSVAHHILSSLNHPLHEAFVQHSDVTIGQVKFYKALIRDINAYIVTHTRDNTLSDEERQTLDLMTDKFRFSILDLCGKKGRSASYFAKGIMEKTQSITRHLDPVSLDSMKTDKDFIDKYKKYKQVLTEYMSKLSPAEKRSMAKKNRVYLENVDALLKDLVGTVVAPRSVILSKLDDLTAIAELKSELHDKQSDLRNNSGGERVLKRAFNRQYEIAKEIELLKNKEYDFYGMSQPSMEELDTRIIQLKNIPVAVRTSLHLIKTNSRESKTMLPSNVKKDLSEQTTSTHIGQHSRLFPSKTKAPANSDNAQSRPQVSEHHAPKEPTKRLRPGRMSSQE